MRNLVLLNFNAGSHGINFSQGAQLTVEECEIYNIPLDAIHVTAAPSALTVENTTIRNGGGSGGFIAGSGSNQVSASLERVALLSLNAGLTAQ